MRLTQWTLAGVTFVTVCSATLVRANAGPWPADIQTPLGIRLHPNLGQILTDADGRTLYWSEADEEGVSHCSATCLQTWEPLLVAPEDLGLMQLHRESDSFAWWGPVWMLERPDGSLQLTWDGSPLYRRRNDAGPGDVAADSMDGGWSVVRLAPRMWVRPPLATNR
jgi:predicted lipoprotein with Yx(FWY)xxD motif